MKCPNCRSQMFVTDENVSSLSQVTFYRCSLCVSEHVSSEPVREASNSYESTDYFETSSTDQKRYLMV